MKNDKLYPVYSCTRSYSRKVSANYQTTDYFSSRSYSWFIEPTKDEVQIKSEELYQECRAEVEAAIYLNQRAKEIEKNSADKKVEEANLQFDLDLQHDEDTR